jgi:hypothetical protein
MLWDRYPGANIAASFNALFFRRQHRKPLPLLRPSGFEIKTFQTLNHFLKGKLNGEKGGG